MSSPSVTDSPNIHQIPPEILGKIFGFAVAACRESCHFNRASYGTWYSFALVSQYWRSVALSTPHIWGTLLFFNQKLISVMLERSRMADISVDSELCFPRLSAVVPLVKQVINEYTSRITELSLKVGDSVFLVLMEELEKRPPSLRLRELRLQCIFGTESWFDLNTVLIPDRLEVLEARGFNIAWEPSQLYPCLTDLTICSTRSVPWAGFVDALRGMPALQFLCLRNCRPSEQSFTSITPVHLGKLRKLEVSASIAGFSSISIFLALISIPATTDIGIVCVTLVERGSIGLYKISAFASSVNSLIRNAHLENGGCCYKSLSIHRLNDVLNISASRSDFAADDFALNFSLTIELTGYTPEETLRKVLFPAILGNSVVSLRLKIGVRSRTLLELSDSLPCLRNVILVRDSMPNFVAVMMLANHTSYPFQNIRYLVLYGAVFTPRINGGLEVSELRECIERRSKSDAKLETLKISQCYGILKHNIQRLRETVNVDWDGYQSKWVPPRN